MFNYHLILQRELLLILRYILATLASFFLATTFVYAAAPALKTIAITQIVSHASLDKVQRGIVDELISSGYQPDKTARFVFANAEGSAVVAAQIAGQFVASHPDVIIAIATPSAQAIAHAIAGTTIPLVFASISDPVQAKLVTHLKHPGMNITGTRNVTPMDQQIAFMQRFLPHLKTIGIVLNYGEANSVDLLKAITDQAKKANITVIGSAASNSADVGFATANLVGKVDALFLLQDNTVASALPALLKVANENKMPVFSSYVDAVTKGALAGLAFDEYAIGRQTGKMAVAILQGAKPGDLAVEDPKDIERMINLKTAERLQIKVGGDVMRGAKIIT